MSSEPLSRPSPSIPPAPADGRRVLVTGGARRLGAAICRAFARAGWEVLCHYGQSREEALALCAELRAAGHRAHALPGDLGSEAGREALMAVACADGPLQALVNNASSFEPDDALDFDTQTAARQLELNLLAPLSLARLLLRGRPATAVRPCVIHVLDQKVYNLNPDYFSYTLSKLALERAVALQAQALAPQARVCGVAPGLMFLSGPQTPENFARASRANLLREPIDPAAVAEGCVFLAANPAITGTTLSIDCGQHLVPTPRDILFVVDELLKDPKA